MAAPADLTFESLGSHLPAQFVLNSQRSTDHTEILKLQGVNYLIRTASASATIYLTITSFPPDQVKMKQTAMSSKLPGTEEDYPLDWTWRGSKNALFGDVEGRARLIGVTEAKDQGGVVSGQIDWMWGEGEEEKLLQVEGKVKSGKWEARHLLGFENLEGEKRFTRRVFVKNDEGEELRGVMVWDWAGQK